MNYALPRTHRCANHVCPQYGRTWTVAPREVQPGLGVWDDLVCLGCGMTPPILPEKRLTVEFTEKAPPGFALNVPYHFESEEEAQRVFGRALSDDGEWVEVEFEMAPGGSR